MRISDWSSDVCSSDVLYALSGARAFHHVYGGTYTPWQITDFLMLNRLFPRSVAYCYDQLAYRLNRLAGWHDARAACHDTVREMVADLEKLDSGEILRAGLRSEEHKSDLKSLMH